MNAPAGASAPHSLWLRLAPLIFLLLWSAGFTFAKLGIAYTGPLMLLALRYALAVVVLAVLFLVMRPPLPRTLGEWRHLVVVGFLIQVVYFGLSYLAFRTVSAGVVALIVSLQPVLVALLAPMMLGERVGILRWLGLGLGLLGSVIVIAARASVEIDSALGIVLAVGSLLGMTLAMLYEKRYGMAQHPVTANLVQYLVGFLFCAPAAYFWEDLHIDWSVTFVISIGYLVIFNSLIAISLLLAMIRAGEASRVSSLFFFVPPAAALIAWLALGEAMPPLAWGGMALAVLGVALATRSA